MRLVAHLTWLSPRTSHTSECASAARVEVHESLKKQLADVVASGDRAVVDTSFWSRASRDEYRRFLAPLGVKPVVYFVETPRDVLLLRLKARTNHGPNDISVPDDVAMTYLDRFEVPTPSEGPLRVLSGVDVEIDEPNLPVGLDVARAEYRTGLDALAGLVEYPENYLDDLRRDWDGRL